MTDITITLPPALARTVETRVEAGDYSSASEMVTMALSLLEGTSPEDAEALPSLRQAWAEGLASGNAGPVDFDELRMVARARLDAKTAQ